MVVGAVERTSDPLGLLYAPSLAGGRFLFDAVTIQVTPAAISAEPAPAKSAGVRLGSNGSGPEYAMPIGLVQTTGDTVSSPVVGSEVNDCTHPHGATKA